MLYFSRRPPAETRGFHHALERAGEINAEEAQTKRKERKDDARVRRRRARRDPGYVDAAIGKAPTVGSGQVGGRQLQLLKAPPRQVEGRPSSRRALPAQGELLGPRAHIDRERPMPPERARRPIAALPDTWLGGIAGRVAPPANAVERRARVLKEGASPSP